MYHNIVDCQGNTMFAGFEKSDGITTVVQTKVSNGNGSLKKRWDEAYIVLCRAKKQLEKHTGANTNSS